jgi:uncharacterized protein YgiB involved in biofilm formation
MNFWKRSSWPGKRPLASRHDKLIFPGLSAEHLRGTAMKRSRVITLTLLASATVLLTACSSEQATRREMYQNKQKCVEDWGSDDKCEATSSGHYYGPHYYWSSGRPYYYPRNGSSPEIVRSGHMSSLTQGGHSANSISSISSSVSRGGFGHSSSSHSSGS